MNLLNAIAIGFKEIWAHKFRSMLTMLGIILGVSSLVAMSAMVKGMENGMKEALIAIGGLEKVRVEEQDIPIYQRHLADQATGCTLDDVYALERSAPLISMVVPEMRPQSRGAIVTYGGKSLSTYYFIGTWPSALEINQHVVEHGRMFNEVDDENFRRVCVIGTGVRDAIFGDPAEIGEEIIPVGKTIEINNQPFRIVGMFQHYESEQDRVLREAQKNAPKEQGVARSRGWGGKRGRNYGFWMKNNTIYIPLNTMRAVFRAGSGTSSIPDERLSGLSFKIRDIESMEQSLQQARNVLMHTHNGIEDFAFQTQEDQASSITTVIRNARLSGGIIAGISLLVGGIGIMNIMLASITERIREIGIRKAIGAGDVAVFIQILVESVVIAMLGGLMGLATSFGLVQGMSGISPSQNAPVMTVTSMSVAFLFSVAVGVLAGLIPAFKAARLDPIQALRYE